MIRSGMRTLVAGALLSVTALGTGCLYSRSVTNTARSATEQLLLTTSIERALDRLELPPLEGRSVSVEVVALDAGAAPYLEHALRDRLLQRGARLDEAGAGDMHLVLRAGAIGTVSRNLLFGIPPVPVPGAAITVPGLPIISSLKQRGYTQLRLTGVDRNGRLAASTGPVTERAVFDVVSILIFAFPSEDIYPPEKSFGTVGTSFTLE